MAKPFSTVIHRVVGITPSGLIETLVEPLLAIGNDRQWKSFCDSTGLERLIAGDRFSTNQSRVKNRHFLIPVLQRMFRHRKAEEWHRILVRSQVPVAPSFQYSRRGTRSTDPQQEDDGEVRPWHSIPGITDEILQDKTKKNSDRSSSRRTYGGDSS